MVNLKNTILAEVLKLQKYLDNFGEIAQKKRI